MGVKKEQIGGKTTHVVYGSNYFSKIAMNIDQGTLGYGQVLEDVILEVLQSDGIAGDNLNPSSAEGSETDFPFADIVTRNEGLPVLYSVKSTLQPLAGKYKTTRKLWVKGMEECVTLDGAPDTLQTFVGPGLIWCQLDVSLTAGQIIPPTKRSPFGTGYSPPIEIPDPSDPKKIIKPMGESGGFIPGIVFRFKKITPKSDSCYQYKIDTLKSDGDSILEVIDADDKKVNWAANTTQITSIDKFKRSFGPSNGTNGTGFSESTYQVLISPAPNEDAYKLIRAGQMTLSSDEYKKAVSKIFSFAQVQMAAAIRTDSKADAKQKAGLKAAAKQLFPSDLDTDKKTRFFPAELGLTIPNSLLNKLHTPGSSLSVADYVLLKESLTSYYAYLRILANQNLKEWEKQNQTTSPEAMNKIELLLNNAVTLVYMITEAGELSTPGQMRQFVLANRALNKIQDSLGNVVLENNLEDLDSINDVLLELIEVTQKIGDLIRALPDNDYNKLVLDKIDEANSIFTIEIANLQNILGPQTLEQQLDQDLEIPIYDDIQEPADLQVTSDLQGEFDFQTPDSPLLKFEGRKRMKYSLLDLDLLEEQMVPMPALGAGSAQYDSRRVEDPFDIDQDTMSLLGLLDADEVDIDETDVDTDLDGIPNRLDDEDDTHQGFGDIMERFLRNTHQKEDDYKKEKQERQYGLSHAALLKKKYYGRY